MRKTLAGVAAGVLMLTGCAEPREESSVEVTPPPPVEVPVQTIFHQALTETMNDEAIISTGLPAVEALKTVSARLNEFSPEPAACSGMMDPDHYTTNDVALGFYNASTEDEHRADTVVAADFDTAEAATDYFTARTEPWVECDSVDLTIDETNVLTLDYTALGFAEADAEVPAQLLEADQDLIMTSAGELSGAFETSDVAVPDPGGLPDYVISPDEVPEPEVEAIEITNATVVARFDTQVFWVTVEPGQRLQHGIDTLAAVVEAVSDRS